MSDRDTILASILVRADGTWRIRFHQGMPFHAS